MVKQPKPRYSRRGPSEYVEAKMRKHHADQVTHKKVQWSPAKKVFVALVVAATVIVIGMVVIALTPTLSSMVPVLFLWVAIIVAILYLAGAVGILIVKVAPNIGHARDDREDGLS